MELTDRSARRRTTSGVALLVGVVAAGVACGAALLLAGGAPSPAPAGLADPGPVVGWGRRAAEGVTLLASVFTVGALLVAGALAPPGSPTAIRARRAAAVAAWTWMATVLLTAVLEACDLAGVRLRDLDLAVLQGWLDQSSRLLPLMGAVLAGVIAASIPVATTRRGTQALLVLALLDAAVLGLDGHAARTASWCRAASWSTWSRRCCGRAALPACCSTSEATGPHSRWQRPVSAASPSPASSRRPAPGC